MILKFSLFNPSHLGLPRWLSRWRIFLQFRRHRRCGFDPWVGNIPWRRKWQPTPACLPGESHGQRSLVGYSPWGQRESDTTSVHGTVLCPGSGVHSWVFLERLRVVCWGRRPPPGPIISLALSAPSFSLEISQWCAARPRKMWAVLLVAPVSVLCG